ncbi:MAG: hypothetical protein ACTHM6_01215 [Tepidisphaeraceae bacterium]
MSTLLKDLNYPDAVLLMYLANELPAEDRKEIDDRLEEEPELYDKLDELRAAYGAVDAFIGAGDATWRVSPGLTAARNLGDVVRERQRNKKAEEREVLQRRRGWWMMYPAAAAALLAIGMVAWYRSAKNEMNAPVVDPMVAVQQNWRGGMGGEWGWRLLTPPPAMDQDLDQMSDDDLKGLFDPMVNDQSFRMNRELSALQFMDDGLN